MIGRKTCLVLGAGASVPYGFPSGVALRRMIVGHAAIEQHDLHLALRAANWSAREIKDFVHAFAMSRQESIDAFLAARSEFQRIGAHAIAAALILHEVPERLTSPPDPDDDWISYLWASLQDATRAHFAENQLSVVSFNYDRVLERSLIDAFQHSFGGTVQDAAGEIGAAIPIVKVHGSIGRLVEYAGDEGRLYRPVAEGWAVQQAGEQIQVLSEVDVSSPLFAAAQDLIREAERVIFLGCAYHPENMHRLRLPKRHAGVRIGTGFGLTSLERDRAQASHGIQIPNTSWKTRQFLREFIHLSA